MPLAPDAVRLTPPVWAEAYMRMWQARLGLDEWEIKLVLEDRVDGSANIFGQSRRRWKILEAEIALRADLEDTPFWRVTIIHEVLHVLQTNMECSVDDALTGLPKPARKLARETHGREFEQYTARLARALYRMEETIRRLIGDAAPTREEYGPPIPGPGSAASIWRPGPVDRGPDPGSPIDGAVPAWDGRPWLRAVVTSTGGPARDASDPTEQP